jgi:hypothetical protein
MGQMKWGKFSRLGYLSRDGVETSRRDRKGIPMQTDIRSGRDLSAPDTLTMRPNKTGK